MVVLANEILLELRRDVVILGWKHPHLELYVPKARLEPDSNYNLEALV